MGIGGAKEGVIEYSDEFKFLEDKRTFKIKMYGMGRAYDNTVSVLLATLNYQFKLPFEMEVLIKDNDPVRLLSAFVEELELTDLYKFYGKIKKSGVTASDV